MSIFRTILKEYGDLSEEQRRRAVQRMADLIDENNMTAFLDIITEIKGERMNGNSKNN